LTRFQAGRLTCTDPSPGVRSFIESALVTLGRNSQLPLRVDCRFGSNTELGTRAFQACSGVARDGRIGPITWPLLDAFAPTRPMPPPLPPTGGALAALERRYFPPPGTRDAAPFSRPSTITPIVDGHDYFAAIRAQIGALVPGDALYLAGWWLDPGFRFADGSTLADLLVDRASVGVDVRVIAWANRQVLDNPRLAGVLVAGPYMRVIRDNIQAAELLRARTDASGHVALAGRVLIDWSGNAASSHHMKFTVFSHDSSVTAFVGGIDYQQNRLDAPMHRSGVNFWHDAGVQLGGDAATRALATFVTRWTEASTLSAANYDIGGGPKPYNPAPIVPLTPPTGTTAPASATTSVQVVRSFPDSKEFGFLRNTPWTTLPRSGVHEAKRTFQTALAAAQRYIYIEDQSFDAVDSLFPSLVAACQRGVKVIAVLPGTGDPLDAPGTRPHTLTAPVVDGLVSHLSAAEQENLAVWELDGIIVHAKLVLIDDEYLSIGSANFMDRSMQFTLQGDDSELTAAAVSTGTLPRDLRVALWAEHLRVTDAAALSEIGDLGKSLGFWRPSWGSGISSPHPDTRLVFAGPVLGAARPRGGGRSTSSLS
jgi:phosphatidylserine/phosphatidylglycerophosphate/cardiolipin synthase-like enzyme